MRVYIYESFLSCHVQCVIGEQKAVNLESTKPHRSLCCEGEFKITNDNCLTRFRNSPCTPSLFNSVTVGYR